VVEWGEGIFGVEAAARYYYGKSAAALGPEEAARLAVVLPNPRKLHPNGNSRYVAKRAEAIQDIMIGRGIIIPAYEEVMAPEKGTVEGRIVIEDPGEAAVRKDKGEN
jgi:monofunctional glycosyltransferase